MSYFEYINCPYCGNEINATEIEFDGFDEIDIECPSCEKEFEVIREWHPTYSANAITFSDCQECGKTERDKNIYLSDDKELCQKCFYKRELAKLEGNIR